jgi:hypothetical protein
VGRALAMRTRGRRLTGRVGPTDVLACARGVPVRLERRRHGRWNRVRSARTGTSRRFAFTLPRTRDPLRVRLPEITRTDDGAAVRCAPVARRVRLTHR